MEFKKKVSEEVQKRIDARKAETVEPAIQGLPEKKASERKPIQGL